RGAVAPKQPGGAYKKRAGADGGDIAGLRPLALEEVEGGAIRGGLNDALSSRHAENVEIGRRGEVLLGDERKTKLALHRSFRLGNEPHIQFGCAREHLVGTDGIEREKPRKQQESRLQALRSVRHRLSSGHSNGDVGGTRFAHPRRQALVVDAGSDEDRISRRSLLDGARNRGEGRGKALPVMSIVARF